mmetsp:Transcript_64968/g.116839  ORF Transcript_64968/g.116839 Transcript_64968/m.116839 type:complete len:164 (+) Transcript_64968:1307-1798(+)
MPRCQGAAGREGGCHLELRAAMRAAAQGIRHHLLSTPSKGRRILHPSSLVGRIARRTFRIPKMHLQAQVMDPCTRPDQEWIARVIHSLGHVQQPRQNPTELRPPHDRLVRPLQTEGGAPGRHHRRCLRQVALQGAVREFAAVALVHEDGQRRSYGDAWNPLKN